jgi:hypothetical protein
MEEVRMGNEGQQITAPATIELDKSHESFLSSLDTFAKDPKPEAFGEVTKVLTAYRGERAKYLNAEAEYRKALEAKNAPPEKYEFKLGEDSPLGKDYLTTFSVFAKEKKLSADRATEVLTDRDSTVRAFIKQREQDFGAMLKKDADTLAADQVMGRDNLKQTEELITRFVETFGDARVGNPGDVTKGVKPSADYKPGTLDLLKAAGATVNPMVVKMLLKAAQAIKPENLKMPNTAPDSKQKMVIPVDAPPVGFSQTKAEREKVAAGK